MAGEIQLNGTSFATESSSVITLNSNVVLPGQKVQNIVYSVKSDENSASTTSTSLSIVKDASNNEEWAVTISGLSSNKVLLMFQVGVLTTANTSTTRAGLGICRDTISNIIYESNVESIQNYQGTGSSLAKQGIIATLIYVDTPTSSSHTYKLCYKANADNATRSMTILSTFPNTFLAMEILT